MNDYISREAAFKEFAEFVRGSNNSDFVDAPTWNDAVSLIGSLPAADVVTWEQLKKAWAIATATDVVEVKRVSAKTPPGSERNIFICYGNPAFRSVCVGHYDHEMERFYEDRNFFAKPIYDAMYWCDMPRVPETDGCDYDAVD